VSVYQILASFRERGFTLTGRGRDLLVRPAANLTAEDRAVLRANLATLVATIDGVTVRPIPPPSHTPPAWDAVAAARLLHDADGLVARLGVRGTHPDVAAAAGVVCSAFAVEDLETVRFAVSRFVTVVRRVAEASGQKRPG
jgi:hypothetical protein